MLLAGRRRIEVRPRVGESVRTGSGITQPPIQWLPEALSPHIKPVSGAEAKNGEDYPPLPLMYSWCLIKHRKNFPLPTLAIGVLLAVVQHSIASYPFKD
jgi:hypothetical protein